MPAEQAQVKGGQEGHKKGNNKVIKRWEVLICLVPSFSRVVKIKKLCRTRQSRGGMSIA